MKPIESWKFDAIQISSRRGEERGGEGRGGFAVEDLSELLDEGVLEKGWSTEVNLPSHAIPPKNHALGTRYIWIQSSVNFQITLFAYTHTHTQTLLAQIFVWILQTDISTPFVALGFRSFCWQQAAQNKWIIIVLPKLESYFFVTFFFFSLLPNLWYK